MAYVPGFEHDVFISYAWVNNQADDALGPESGWVTQFRKRLRAGLDEKLGRIGASSFFFDVAGMNRDRDFNPQIEAAIRSSATVVAFFSEGYLASKACCEEMRLFNELAGAAHETGRVFLVRISDLPQETWPETFRNWFRNVLGYVFFERLESKGVDMQLQAGEKAYLLELERLRKSLGEKLKEMKQKAEQKPAAPAADRPTVVIGQTTADLRAERNALISYCRSAELTVLPEGTYPTSPEKFRELFQQHLKQANVFVQLLSSAWSDRTDEFPDGVESFQFERAQVAKSTILRWRRAEDLSAVDDELHKRLLMSPDVRSDLPAVFHQAVVDAAQNSFQMARDAQHGGPAVANSRLVLVRADENDAEATRTLAEQLAKANIRCRVARNGVPLVDRLRSIRFDALVVMLGKCSSEWVEEQGDELLAVDQNLKDQTPLCAYCHHPERRIVPPFLGGTTLELVTPLEIDRLIQAIVNRGVKR